MNILKKVNDKLVKINERLVIKQIKNITKDFDNKGFMERNLVYVKLNGIKNKNAIDLLSGCITTEFYKKVFLRWKCNSTFF